MGIFDTYSKRLKRHADASRPIIYQIDELPQNFRVQVIYIWKSAVGQSQGSGYGPVEPPSAFFWKRVHDVLTRERGTFSLATVRPANPWRNQNVNYSAECWQFFLETDTAGALDMLDLAFRMIDKDVRKWSYADRQLSGAFQSADEAIAELNRRFREHCIGYQFADGEIVRVDSEYVHSEMVEPALTLLHDARFRGAEDEFLSAHKHYREGRIKEAITEACKAFESTMKAICTARKWQYEETASAKTLVKLMLDNGIIPKYLESYFNQLQALLDGGLPTVRNKASGHGQGTTPTTIPPHLGAYALHLAAANILLLVEAHKAQK